jgi:putative flippase GtrA
MADERFLITGGTGCIVSWVVRVLFREGVPVRLAAYVDRVLAA